MKNEYERRANKMEANKILMLCDTTAGVFWRHPVEKGEKGEKKPQFRQALCALKQ